MRATTSSRLRSVLSVLGKVALFFLAFALSSAVFIAPVASKLAEWSERFPVRTLLYTSASAAVALLLATWAMTRFVDRRPFSTIGFSFDHLARDIATGLLVGISWLAASVALLWVAGWAFLSPEAPASAASAAAPALVIAALAVLLNALAQQLLVCGYIFQAIRERSNFATALLVSSGLFSLYHAGAFQGDWLPPVNVFLAGVVFCLAYGMTGNLWFPTAIHFAWNCLLGPVLGLTVSGTGELAAGWNVLTVEGPTRWTGGAFGPEGGLVVTLTTVTLVVALALANRKSGQPVEWFGRAGGSDAPDS